MVPSPSFYIPRIWMTALMLLLLTPSQGHAQDEPMKVRTGVKMGVNFASLTGSYLQLSGPGAGFYEAEVGARTGFAIGGYTILPLSAPVFLQPEILYVQKGARIEITGLSSGTGTLKAGYLEAPILLRFEIPIDESTQGMQVKPYILGGPTIGARLHAGSEATGDAFVEEDFGDVANILDIGLTAGAGVGHETVAGTAVAEVRVSLGVSDVISSSDDSARTRGIMITVGLIF